MGTKNIMYAKRKTENKDKTQGKGYEKVIVDMAKDISRIWTSVEPHETYMENGGNQLSKSALVHKLPEFRKKFITAFLPWHC